MPQEAVYKRVDTGREGDRVFLMEIVGVRSFFWMQDKSPDKDEVQIFRNAPLARGSSPCVQATFS